MHFHSPVEKVITLWIIGVIVSVVAAIGALYVTNKAVYGPEGKVREYFQALQAGNGSHALGLLNAEIPEGDAALLDGDTLKRAAAAIKDIDISVVEKSADGNSATVRAAYSIEGEREHTDFRVHRDGTHWGVFNRWAIDGTSLPTLKVKIAGADAATINNRKVPVLKGEAAFPALYPGAYAITYDSALYTADARTQRVISADNSQQADISLQPSENALESVQDQVHQYIDKCAEQNSLYPAGCPFEHAFNGRVEGEVSWSVVQYPEPEVKAESEKTWRLSPAEGKVKVSFTQVDLYSGNHQEVEKEVPFTLKGVAEVDAQRVRVSF